MKRRERSKDEIPFREMTPVQKRSYIWDYWRIPALMVVVTAAVVITFIYTMATGKETLFSVMTVDSGGDAGFTPYAEQFADEHGIPRDQLVVADVVVGSSETGGGVSSQAGMALYVRMQAGSEDIIIMPEAIFEELASGGYFLDLTEVVPEQWQDQVIVVDQRYDEYDEVQPEPVACGIHMRDIPGMPDTPYYQDAVIAVSYYPNHFDTAVAFLNSLLE